MERFTRMTVALTLLVLFAGAIVLLPLAALDAKSLRAAVEKELTLRTGLKARVLGKIDVSVFGGPAVRFGRVTLVNEQGNISADITDMAVSISYISALTNNPAFTRIDMTGPRLTIAERKDGDPVSFPGKAHIESLLADLSLESLSITNGRIIILREPAGVEFVDAIDLEATRRDEGRQIAVTGTLTWRNNRVSGSGDISNLTALLNDTPTQASLSIRSRLASASISGDLSLSPAPIWQGELAVSTSNSKQLVSWLAPDWTGDTLFSAIGFTGTGQIESRRVRLDTVQLDIGGAAAQGSLDLGWTGDRPKLLGTMAFDAVSLALKKPNAPADASEPGVELDVSMLPIDIAKAVDLDLRFSASALTANTLTATDVGATVLSAGDRLTLELGGANLLGGTGRLSLMIEGITNRFTARLRASGKDLDLSGLLAALGREGGPQGRLSGDGELLLRGVMPRATARSTEGSINIALETPQWKGGDIRAALSAGFGRMPSPPAQLPGLPSDLTRLSLKAKYAVTKTSVETLEVEAPGFRAKLSGDVEPASRGLSLTGVAEFFKDAALPSQTEAKADLTLPIKVGGVLNSLTVDFKAAENRP